MHDDADIRQWLLAALENSGLSMDRRAIVADELRDHIEQLVAENRNQGLSPEAARAAALERFGSPEVVRAQLRAQQWATDRRAAWAKTRRDARWLIVIPVVLAALFGLLRPDSASLWERLPAAATFLACLIGVMLPAMYIATVCERRISRRRPRREFHFARSLGRSILMVGAGLAGLVLWALVTIGLVAPTVGNVLWQDASSWSMWASNATVLLEPLMSNDDLRPLSGAALMLKLAGTLLLVLGGAASITLYDRSRCVHDGELMPPTSA